MQLLRLSIPHPHHLLQVGIQLPDAKLRVRQAMAAGVRPKKDVARGPARRKPTYMEGMLHGVDATALNEPLLRFKLGRLKPKA